MEYAFFGLSIQRRPFWACVRSETPRYILISLLVSAAPAHAYLMLMPRSASLLAMKAKLPGLSAGVSTSTFSSANPKYQRCGLTLNGVIFTEIAHVDG